MLQSEMITPAQCRAARALVGWSQQRLADVARVGVVTVRQFEGGGSRPREATMQVVVQALESAGCLFLAEGETTNGGPGVRLRQDAGTGNPPTISLEDLNAENDE